MDGVPAPHVVPVERDESIRAGGVLGKAFADTKQWAMFLPGSSARQRKFEQMFVGTVKLTFAAGGIAERTAGFEAIALWLPPGHDIGFRAMVRSGFASARFAVTPPFPNMRKMTAMLREFEATHKHNMPDPHWYLMALGVDPAHHRNRHGSVLVEHGIRRAEEGSYPIYLETESGGNVDFYRTLGFEVLKEIVIKAIDLRFTLLVHGGGR